MNALQLDQNNGRLFLADDKRHILIRDNENNVDKAKIWDVTTLTLDQIKKFMFRIGLQNIYFQLKTVVSYHRKC